MLFTTNLQWRKREFPIQLIIHASVVDCSIGTIFSHIKQNMTVRFSHPTGGRVAKKIWTTQQGLLDSVIIPKRYSCRHGVAFYGPDNDVPCLKYCWRWVIVSLDLHFGDNCFLGGEIWPRREDSFVWLRIGRRTAIVFLVSLIIDSDDLIQ